MKKINICCRSILFFLLFIIFFVGFFGFSSEIHIIKKEYLKESNNYNIKQSANNGIIEVNNNSDLKKVSSSGNGSASNPYIIENKIISGEAGLYCIFISNTSKYFVLRNCFLSNASFGLFLSNVVNALIGANYINNNLERGIYVENSFNNTFLGNSIFENSRFGIFLDNCSFNEIENNLIFENNITGAFLNNSLYNNVTDNTIDGHYCPIFLSSSNYTNVLNNNGKGNTLGIIEENSNSNIIEGNRFTNVVSREKIEGSKIKKSVIFDFTIILVLIMGFFGFFYLINQRFKMISLKKVIYKLKCHN